MSCILLFELDFGLGEIIHGVIKQIGVNKGLMIYSNIFRSFECAYAYIKEEAVMACVVSFFVYPRVPSYEHLSNI